MYMKTLKDVIRAQTELDAIRENYQEQKDDIEAAIDSKQEKAVELREAFLQFVIEIAKEAYDDKGNPLPLKVAQNVFTNKTNATKGH